MATDIAVGQNRSALQTGADAQRATPETGATNKVAAGRMTKTGDASTVTFNQAISLGAAPTRVKLFPRSAAAAALHWVPTTGNTNVQFSVTFTAAPPAAANNIVFDYEAYV